MTLWSWSFWEVFKDANLGEKENFLESKKKVFINNEIYVIWLWINKFHGNIKAFYNDCKSGLICLILANG